MIATERFASILEALHSRRIAVAWEMLGVLSAEERQSPEAEALVALTLVRAGRLQEAQDGLARLLGEEPLPEALRVHAESLGDLLFADAVALHKAGGLGEALFLYQMVARLQPGRPAVCHNLMELVRQVARWPAGTDPKKQGDLFRAATALLAREGRFDEANECCAIAVKALIDIPPVPVVRAPRAGRRLGS